MRKLFLFILALLAFGTTQAQQDFLDVDKWLHSHADEMGGRAILLVFKDEKIVYSNSVNNMTRKQEFVANYLAKRQGKTADLGKFTPTTRLAIASCSKWLSAALVMTFVDEGRLNLNDTVGKYLPALSKSGKGSITISDCLSHTTGIKSPDLGKDLKDMKTLNSMDEAIARIAQFPMEGKPGKVFRYSNTGLEIAGAIVEKIGGKSFSALFDERIAQPLEMANTDFGKAKVPLPAGGASSTPADYIHFLTMILNKGTFHGKRILSEKSIGLMQVNRITPDVKVAYSPAEAGNLGYGYGEWVIDNGCVGSPGMFGSYPWVDNNRKYCAFLMTFYLKPDGRKERYAELKKLVDKAID
ncbi:MAG: serine hydrolase [Bacteroidales bacterium 45-6]|nr:MAG: serine hydrolase [Bacteroidales bacterium 45-6]